ncbi:hypothetical protein CR513_19151, partial [Mucuna pruriens]
MAALCEQFKIRHHNSTPYRPKANGTVEATNKNIKKIIQKMVVMYRDWHEMLPPFMDIGQQSTLLQVEIPSLWVLMEAELEEAEWLRTRYDQLNLIEGKRLFALCQGQLY